MFAIKNNLRKIFGFGICLILGFTLSNLSIMFLYTFNLTEFAVLYTTGNIVSILSTGFLVGFMKQIKTMFAPDRLIAGVIYFGTLVATFVVAFKLQDGVLCIILCVIQWLAFFWYCASYVSYGRTIIKKVLGSYIEEQKALTAKSQPKQELIEEQNEECADLTTKGSHSEPKQELKLPFISTIFSKYSMLGIIKGILLRKKRQVYGFGICFILGFTLSNLSIMFLFTFKLNEFAVLYTTGNIVSISSTGFLVGSMKQIKTMFAPDRLIAGVIYFGTLIATLVVAFKLQNGVLCIILCIIQWLAFFWYCASYIPYGRAIITKIFRSYIEEHKKALTTKSQPKQEIIEEKKALTTKSQPKQEIIEEKKALTTKSQPKQEIIEEKKALTTKSQPKQELIEEQDKECIDLTTKSSFSRSKPKQELIEEQNKERVDLTTKSSFSHSRPEQELIEE